MAINLGHDSKTMHYKLPRHYPGIYGDMLEGYMNEKRYEKLATLLREYSSDGKRILDVGCGKAPYFQYFKCEAKVGLDISKHSLSIARKKNVGTHFLIATVTNLPLRDSSFDVVLSSQVVEHLPKHVHSAFFSEIRRVLSDGGILILSTPNREDLKGMMKRFLPNRMLQLVKRSLDENTECAKLRRKQFEEMRKEVRIDVVSHKYEYTPEELERSLEGFTVLRRMPVTLAWFPLIAMMEKLPATVPMILSFIKTIDESIDNISASYRLTWGFILVAKKQLGSLRQPLSPKYRIEVR